MPDHHRPETCRPVGSVIRAALLQRHRSFYYSSRTLQASMHAIGLNADERFRLTSCRAAGVCRRDPCRHAGGCRDPRHGRAAPDGHDKSLRESGVGDRHGHHRERPAASKPSLEQARRPHGLPRIAPHHHARKHPKRVVSPSRANRFSATALDQYYEAQRRLRVALAARPAPPAQNPQALPDPRWLITDFVTLGSPLAHAEFLIAASADDLAKRKFERELPESPPLREELDPNVFRLAQATHKLPVGADFKTSKLISFPPPSAPHVWELHHAAPFAVVRWTNVYDTASLVFRGDI